MSAGHLPVDPVDAALALLGATLHGRGARATIVEVEAYGGPTGGSWPDAAAHSYCGPTARNSIMFGPPGRLYTYRSHGIHVCANVVCGGADEAAAVLVRAARITDGVDIARHRRRPDVATSALARGPGNLCAALGITMGDNGIDLFSPQTELQLELASAGDVRRGPRVGVSKAADREWRFWLADTPEVSAYRRSPRAPAPGGSD